MNLRPLIIDATAKENIASVTAYAKNHPVSIQTAYRTLSNPALAVGNDPGHRCVVQLGYQCVYSIEQQPIGWCRHLSVSVSGDGDAPNEKAVEMLMPEFGFRGGLKELDKAWTEDIGGKKVAINVLQLRDAEGKK